MAEKIRRGLGVALALVICPCHLPLWLGLLAGTALGTYLSAHWGFTVAASTLLFLGGLALALLGFEDRRNAPGRARRRPS